MQVRCQSCPKEVAFEYLAKHERVECEQRDPETTRAQEEAEAARMRAGREAAARAERRAALLNGVGESGAADGDGDGDEEGDADDGAEFYAAGARQVAENNLAAELLAEGMSLQEVAEILQVSQRQARRMAREGKSDDDALRSETRTTSQVLQAQMAEMEALIEEVEGDMVPSGARGQLRGQR